MRPRVFQRGAAWAGTTGAAVGLVWLHDRWEPVLPRMTFLTGWVLFAILLLLSAYNGRKKLPFLPLLSSRAWLEFHLVAGWLSGVLFLLHVRFRIVTGAFEQVLAGLFVVVMASGIAGWILSRLLPRRLTTLGGEVLHEQIPALIGECRREARGLVLGVIPAVRAATLAAYYESRLDPFFARSRHFLPHLVSSERPVNRLLAGVRDLHPYLAPAEREAAEKLTGLIRRKDALDRHRALQLLLKGWLFVHIPFTFSLLLATVVHVVLVHAFSGGAR